MRASAQNNHRDWLARSAPGILREAIPSDIARRVKAALQAVDRNIEQTGTVTAETVDLVRMVLAALPK